MAENSSSTNDPNKEDVRREDLNQKHAAGRDSARTGSTGSDINATEWKPDDTKHQRTEDPETGSTTGKGTNAGNGGDYTK